MKRVFLILVGVLIVFMAFTIFCGKKMSEQQYYDLAIEYEQNEDFVKAAETYLTIYKRFPSGQYGAEALFKAALLQANQLKEFDRAIETHKQLIRTFPKSKYVEQSEFMIGFIYANEIQDFEKAKEVYQQFLEKYPENELVSSVRWELDNLGKDINEIKFLSEEKPDTSKSN